MNLISKYVVLVTRQTNGKSHCSSRDFKSLNLVTLSIKLLCTIACQSRRGVHLQLTCNLIPSAGEFP